MKLPPIMLWSVFDLVRRGDCSRTRGFLLQLTRVRFPHRRSILNRIKQGQGHCAGAGPPLITARARHAHTAQGAEAEGRGGATGPGGRRAGLGAAVPAEGEAASQSPGGARSAPTGSAAAPPLFLQCRFTSAIPIELSSCTSQNT